MWSPREWLVGWDASTWALTASDMNFGSAVVGVVELEGRADFAKIAHSLAEATQESSIFRERVVQTGVPLLPGRVELSAFCDINDHLTHVELSEEVTWSDVREVVQHQLEAEFSGERPAWRAVAMTGGVSSAKSFLVVAFHHALIDGNGAVSVAQQMIAGDQLQGGLSRIDAERRSQIDLADALIEMASHAGAKLFVEGTNVLAQALADPNGAVTHLRKLFSSGMKAVNPFARPLSSLFAPRSGSLRVIRMSFDLSPLKQIAADHDVSLTNVLVAGICMGTARYHRRLGDVSKNVRVNLPISMPNSRGERNPLSVARMVLELSEADPIVALKETHLAMRQARHEPALQWTSVAADLSRLLPIETFASVIGGADMTISSLRGPKEPGRLAGLPVKRIVPFAPVFGAAVSWNALSYCDEISVGICADSAAVTHPKWLRRECMRAFEELTASAQ